MAAQRSTLAARVAAWVLLAAIASVWAATQVKPAWVAPSWDLSALMVGARVARDEGFAHLYEHDPVFYNIAESPAFRRAAATLGFTETPTAFVHAPLVAIAARPLAGFPFPSVARVWVVGSTLATLLGLAMGALHFAPRMRGPLAWGAILAALTPFEPIRYGLWLGQTTPFVFCLTMLSLVLAERRRGFLAGTILAVPAFVKLGPALLVIVWLWRKDYRAVSGLVAGIVVLSLCSVIACGIVPNLEYVDRVRTLARETVVAFNNHSLAAFLERLSQPNVEVFAWRTMPISAGLRAAMACSAFAMAGVAYWALRALDLATRTKLATGTVVVAMLLVPSISWTHYFVFLVPILLMLWELAGQLPERSLLRTSLAVPLLLCSRPIFLDQIDRHRGPLGTIIPGPTLAAVLVYVLLVFVGRRLRRDAV